MAVSVSQKAESLSMAAYNKIKSMIFHKELLPGQLINERQLQETLALGRTPVREAILMLAQDKLLSIYPRKGIEITRPTLKDIHDVFQLRELLEPRVLRECFDAIDRNWVREIRRILLENESVPAPAEESVDAAFPLINLDNQFHLGLTDTLHNGYVTSTMHSLVDYLNLILVTTWHTARYRVSNLEHIRILDAILADNADEACRLLEDHLKKSYEEAVNTMMHTPV